MDDFESQLEAHITAAIKAAMEKNEKALEEAIRRAFDRFGDSVIASLDRVSKQLDAFDEVRALEMKEPPP